MQSSSRNGAQVRLLALHTTEGILRVNDLKNWKTWPGSSHATADQYGGFLDGAADGFVDYSRASWTLRSGNPVSDNIELCGFAKWTRGDWLARPKLLESAALWLARRKNARPHIPLVKLTPEQVRAGKAGVIGHNDWTVGMKDGSHWDPGPGFPWDVVLARANALASSAPGSPISTLPVPEDDMQLTDPIESRASEDIDPKTGLGKTVTFKDVIQNIQAKVDGVGDVLGPLDRDLRGDLAIKGRQITALTAAVGSLSGLVAQQNGLTLTDVERVVNDAIARGVQVDVAVGPRTS